MMCASQKARIIELWPNHSATEIARRIGGTCTRNAVIGIAHRAGVKKADPTEKRGGKRLFDRVARIKPAPVPVPVSIEPAPEPAQIAPIPPGRFACPGEALLAAPADGCLWRMGEDGAVWFCGEHRSLNRYCAEHALESVGRGTPSERRAHEAPRSVMENA
jgi:hypothetical protein